MSVSVGTRKSPDKLSKLSMVSLGKLHMYLTKYIVGLQDGNTRLSSRAGMEIRGLIGYTPRSVLEADKLRRRVHKIIIENARRSHSGLVYRNPFVIPDVEAVVLSNIERLREFSVEVDRDSIFISIYGDDETLYGEPVDMKSVNIKWYKGFDKPLVDVDVEIEMRFSDAGIYMNDVELLDRDEGIRILKKYNPEFLEELMGTDTDVDFYVSNNQAYLFFDGSFELPDGRVFFVMENDDTYEYGVAVFFRRGGDVRSSVVEELNKIVGEDMFSMDRIYHVYPAELDAGGPGDSVVHISGSKTLWIEKPSDEIRVAVLVGRILSKLPDI